MVNEFTSDFPYRIPAEAPDWWFVDRPKHEWDQLCEGHVVKPSLRDPSLIERHQPGLIVQRDAEYAFVRWQDLWVQRLPLRRLLRTE